MNSVSFRRGGPVTEELSEVQAYTKEPPRDKGLVYWEAFTTPNPEDQLMQMIRDLPSEDQIETLVGRLRTPQLQYFVRVLSAWISAAEKLISHDNTRIGEKFIELSKCWHDQTDFLSSPSRITENDNYLKIISMGESVIPFILRDLQERGGDWYRALRILSDTDPVPPEVRGDVPQMKEAWLRWGRDKGCIK